MTESRRRWTLIAVALATFMTYLDNNIVNVAIPAIRQDLGLTLAGLEWVVSGYILVFSGLLLVGGRLADLFGRRRLFLLGLGVFTLASLTAGLAGGIDTLVTSRVFQGVGAALVTPTTLAIISDTFRDPKRRNAAVGVWSAVGALALALGPLLGGLISQHLRWGWIFFINVPVGVATMALGALAIRESRDDAVRRHLDVPGLVASAATLFALTYALIEGDRRGWGSPLIIALFLLAAVSAVAFVLVEARSDDPMVDVSLFRDRVFAGGVSAMGLWAFGLFGIYFFTAIYLQEVLGFSPTRAGAAFVPMALLMAGSAGASGPLTARFGARRLVAGGMLLMGGGIASISLLGADASVVQLMPSLLAIGVGGGLTIPLTAAVLGVMPTDRSGVASGILNVSREVAGLFGVTVIGAILSARRTAAMHAGAAPLDAYLTGYRTGLLVAAALVVAGAAVAFVALRRLSGRSDEAAPYRSPGSATVAGGAEIAGAPTVERAGIG